jgi:nucleoside-diphosphate kinase
MKERTLVIIKPDGMKRGLMGECIRRFENEKLKIIQIRIGRLTSKKIDLLKKDIRNNHKIIYNELKKYLKEYSVCAMILEGKNCIKTARKIIGNANPKLASSGTIRKDYAKGDMQNLYKKGKVVKNIIHSSLNRIEAEREIEILFDEKICEGK